MRRLLTLGATAAAAWGLAVMPAVSRPAAVPRRTVVIGHSVDGRRLAARVIGPDSAPRRVLVVGCIHGDECAGLRILSAVAASGPAAGVQLWLVGELNPDGTAAGTRQNADGVDLNRNFPHQWQRITDPTYDSGPRPASEPETQAAMGLIGRIRPAVAIWYHQHQDLVDMAGGDRGVARRYAQLAHLRATCLAFVPGTVTGDELERLARRPMRVRCTAGVALISVVAAALVVAVAAASPPSSGAGRGRAQREAAALLKLVRPPGAATVSATEPTGHHELLARPFRRPALAALVDRHAWWIVPRRA